MTQGSRRQWPEAGAPSPRGALPPATPVGGPPTLISRAAGAPRRRLPTAVLAIPGGGVVGAVLGAWVAVVLVVPGWMLAPASAGGTGSLGLTATAAVFGFFIGLGLGVAGGVLLAVVAVALWAARAVRTVVVLVGGTAVSLAACATVIAFIGDGSSDPQTLAIAALALGPAYGGALLLDWAAGARG